MTDINVFTREPSKQDFASPVQFRFKITKLPLVEYFVQTAMSVQKAELSVQTTDLLSAQTASAVSVQTTGLFCTDNRFGVLQAKVQY